MKRLIFLLIGLMAISLVGCGNNNSNTSSSTETTSAANATDETISKTSNEKQIKSCTKEPHEGYLYTAIYNENGDITSESFYDGRELRSQIDYSLENNGNEVRFTVYDSDGSRESITGTINSSHTKINFIDEDFGETYEAVYDKNGNLLSCDYYDFDGKYLFGYHYTYDEYNSMLTEADYDENKEVRYEEVYTYEYSFDNNNRVSNKEQYINGELWRGWDYTYDENGNILTETCYDENGLCESECYDYTYEYY